jgi:hypothetical protein
MSFKDFNASYDYISIKAGTEVELIFAGEPDCKEKKDGNPSILFNVADIATNSAKLLRCGVVLAGKIKSALRGGDLLGKVAVTLHREGSGMEDTKYSVTKVRELDAKEVAAVKKIDLIDVAASRSPRGARRSPASSRCRWTRHPPPGGLSKAKGASE